MAFICASENPGATGFRQRVEGDAAQAVAGRADFLVDLKAVLQIGAVVGAERTFERPMHVLERRLIAGRGKRGSRQAKTECKTG